MNLLQFFLILKARYRIILATFLLVVITTAVVSLLWPKSYTATTSLLLNYKGMDPVTGLTLPAQLMPGYMATQVDIIQSQKVAAQVVEKTGLAKSPQAQAQFQDATEGKGDINTWLGNLLLKNLDIKPSRESSIIEVSFKGADPNFSAAIANAFAETYLETSIQLKVEPAQKAAGYFGQQIKALRDNLEAAQSKLSKYQQDKGITSVDDRLDVESSRLNELSGQLSIAQSQTIDAQSRNSSAQRNAANSPDVSLSPVVQSLKIDVARAESKLAELSQRLSKNHPQYQSTVSELDNLKSQLRQEIQRTTENISGTAKIGQQREAELKQQVAIQKAKVLELNQLRAEMTVLQKDVETAQLAMTAVTQRFSQTSIEGQSNQSDISILNVAQPPTNPSSPKVFMNILIAVFLGSLLGISLGFLAELADRRVRSKDDLIDILEVPVFAVIDGKPKKPTNLLPRKVQQLLSAA